MPTASFNVVHPNGMHPGLAGQVTSISAATSHLALMSYKRKLYTTDVGSHPA